MNTPSLDDTFSDFFGGGQDACLICEGTEDLKWHQVPDDFNGGHYVCSKCEREMAEKRERDRRENEERESFYNLIAEIDGD